MNSINMRNNNQISQNFSEYGFNNSYKNPNLISYENSLNLMNQNNINENDLYQNNNINNINEYNNQNIRQEKEKEENDDEPIIPERSLTDYINNEFLSDAVLKLNDIEFYFHKIILTSCSDYFNELFTSLKNSNNNPEEIKETENSFNELKIIFEDEKLTKVDEKIMEICIVPFRENEENLKKELKILCELFNVNGNLDKIYEGILLFSKREFIFDTASAINNFIEKVSPKKTGFLISIKDITINY